MNIKAKIYGKRELSFFWVLLRSLSFMVRECIVHSVSHTRSVLQLWIHLNPTFWSNSVIHFGTKFLSNILSLTILEGFSRINCILFTELESSSASIINAVINILRVIMGHLLTVDSYFREMTISVNLFWELFVQILFWVNNDVFNFCFSLHYWPSLFLYLLCGTVDDLCQVLYQLLVFA